MDLTLNTEQLSACRHEFILMFQRYWTDSGRRLVSRRAYLPVGFKAPDLNHLNDETYCFCAKCRIRLHPRQTHYERESARLARKVQRLGAQAGPEQFAEECLEASAILPEYTQVEEGQINLEEGEIELESEDAEVVEQSDLELLSEDEED